MVNCRALRPDGEEATVCESKPEHRNRRSAESSETRNSAEGRRYERATCLKPECPLSRKRPWCSRSCASEEDGESQDRDNACSGRRRNGEDWLRGEGTGRLL